MESERVDGAAETVGSYEREATSALNPIESLLLAGGDEGEFSESALGYADSESASDPADSVTENDAPAEGDTDVTENGSEVAQEVADAGADEAGSEATAEEEIPKEEIPAEEQKAAEKEEFGKRAQERIGELTRKQKEAEEKAAALEAEVERLKAGKAVEPILEASGSQPAVAATAEMERKLASLEEVIALADDNPDGVELDGADGKPVHYSPERLKELKRQATREAGDMRAQIAVTRERATQTFRADEAKFMGIAEKEFTFLKDTGSPQFQMAATIVKQAPELKRFGNWPILVGILANGLVEFVKGQAAPAKVPVAADPATGDATARTVAGKDQQARQKPRLSPVGSSVGSGAPRGSGAAVHRRTQGSRGLAEAAERGDTEAELAALESMV